MAETKEQKNWTAQEVAAINAYIARLESALVQARMMTYHDHVIKAIDKAIASRPAT